MKIIGDKIWAVSSQLQNHFTTMPTNRNAIKYRVLVGKIDELIRGTGCDKRSAQPIRMGSEMYPAVEKLTLPIKDSVIFTDIKP